MQEARYKWIIPYSTLSCHFKIEEKVQLTRSLKMSHWKNKRYILSRDNAARVNSIFHKNIYNRLILSIKSSLNSPGWISWAWRPAPGPGRSSSPSWCPAPCTWCWPPNSWSPESCVSCQSRHLSQTETQLSAYPDQPSPGHLAFSWPRARRAQEKVIHRGG